MNKKMTTLRLCMIAMAVWHQCSWRPAGIDVTASYLFR